jgi:hypothetical protein
MPMLLDATLTQHPATRSYREQGNPLRYAGIAPRGNTLQRSFSHS